MEYPCNQSACQGESAFKVSPDSQLTTPFTFANQRSQWRSHLMSDHNVNRRGFLKIAGSIGMALGIGGVTTARAATTTPQQPWKPAQGGNPDDMDAMHEQGVKTFVDNIGK